MDFLRDCSVSFRSKVLLLLGDGREVGRLRVVGGLRAFPSDLAVFLTEGRAPGPCRQDLTRLGKTGKIQTC